MVSDFKFKLDIFRYADRHGLFFRKAFSEIFLMSKKVIFNKGEEVKFSLKNEPHLVFIHKGAVLGTLSYENGLTYKVIKVPKSVFLTGSSNFLNPSINSQKWEVANRSEFTAIPIKTLMDSLGSVEGAHERIVNHILSVMDFDAKLYLQLLGINSLYDKVDYLVHNHPRWFRKTQKYLANYLNVSQNGLSNAIKNWDQLNFGG